jgi:hypothetical protein
MVTSILKSLREWFGLDIENHRQPGTTQVDTLSGLFTNSLKQHEARQRNPFADDDSDHHLQ